MLAYLAVPTLEGDALRRALIALLMRSPAERVILTAQDWLGLGDGARMNTPSVVGGNWCWRLRQGEMGEAQAQELLRMTAEYGRLNGKKEKGAEE